MLAGDIVHYQELTEKLVAAGAPLATLAQLEPTDETAPNVMNIALTCEGLFCSFPTKVVHYAAWKQMGKERSKVRATLWASMLCSRIESNEPLAFWIQE